MYTQTCSHNIIVHFCCLYVSYTAICTTVIGVNSLAITSIGHRSCRSAVYSGFLHSMTFLAVPGGAGHSRNLSAFNMVDKFMR